MPWQPRHSNNLCGSSFVASRDHRNPTTCSSRYLGEPALYRQIDTVLPVRHRRRGAGRRRVARRRIAVVLLRRRTRRRLGRGRRGSSRRRRRGGGRGDRRRVLQAKLHRRLAKHPHPALLYISVKLAEALTNKQSKALREMQFCESRSFGIEK